MPKTDLSNLQKYITWDVRSKSSKYLNEFENNVTKSITDANIIIMDSLFDNINNKEKLDVVYENIEKITPASDDILLNLSNTLVPNEFLDKISSNFLELFFDKNKNTYSSNIATNDFVKIESANAILKMCSLLILCYIAKNKISRGNLIEHFQPKKIEKKIEKENEKIKENQDLKVQKNEQQTIKNQESTVPEDEKPKSSKKFIFIGLFVVILGIGGYIFTTQNKKDTDVNVTNPEVVDTETQPQNIEGELVTNLGDFLDLTLPSDEIITVPEKGLEKALLDLVLDKSKSVDDSSYWLVLDRVHFSERQTDYNIDSEEQIKNISLIMTSFPKSEIIVGCYTDNLGNPESNKNLSLKRSESFKNGLIKFGIQEKRIKTEGFGQEFASGDNATVEGKKQNRRIAIKLTAK